MTESAGVQVGKRPVSVHGGMTERLEVHVNCLSVGGPRLALHDTEQGFGGRQERRLHEPAKQFCTI